MHTYRINLEPNPRKKLDQLRSWTTAFAHLDRQKLLDLATNPNRNVKNINVRLDALYTLRQKLKTLSTLQPNTSTLTDNELEQLFNLIKDEDDFPTLVDSEELIVEDITHEKGHEDTKHKKETKNDIEQNVALLKSEAALLIVDFGLKTHKFTELRQPLISLITSRLGNLVGDPDHLFIREQKISECTVEVKTTNYFKSFVEALYFIDKEVAKPFMDIFNVSLNDFSYERRTKKAS